MFSDEKLALSKQLFMHSYDSIKAVTPSSSIISLKLDYLNIGK